MHRRSVLIGLAASVIAVAAGVVVAETLTAPAPAPIVPPDSPIPRPTLISSPIAIEPRFGVPAAVRVAIPHGSITGLPGSGRSIALTVDDGTDSEVVRLYTEFARRTGMRITFFLNGIHSSWTDNATALRPLVESGQVQLGNHTWSHPDLTRLTDAGIANELSLNHTFITNTYGVDAAPYFRPPYGFRNARVDRVAASLGYTTPVLWFGSLSDSGLITTDQLRSFADQWMLAQHIVIGHANFLPVTECFDYLADLIRTRTLQPVTLNDYFLH